MAENKKSFLLYCDLIHTIEKMPNDKAGELFKHILEYVNDKDPISEDLITNLTFEPIKQSLKRDLEKYEVVRKRNIENIGKRWNKKDTKNTTGKNGIPNDTKNTVSDSVSDSVSDINNKFTEIFDELTNSQRWIEDTARHLKVSIVNVDSKLLFFLNELKLKDDFHKGIKEIKIHFVNWLKTEIIKEQKDKPKQITVVQKMPKKVQPEW